MNPLIHINAPVTMSSQDIAELVNSRHDKVKQSIERLAERGAIQLPPSGDVKNHLGQTVQVYQIGKRDSYVIVAQLSPEFTARLVDRWQELEQQAHQPRMLTTTETLIQMLTIQAEVERRQAEQAAAITAIDARVERVETAQTILSARPANSESIIHVRKRIRKAFGLSAAIVDAVVRQSPYAPKPAGMVRNEHVEADGAAYAVYWQKDVTATFERFVSEAKKVTGQFFTHPYVDGRFRMVAIDHKTQAKRE
ncbi:Rha family transcriptional regulator [Rhizobium sp. BR 362]|uniref:Rha family transcriptional regulator n=1 Tax=Rhizobium sp. BR 362 TaxID=3040670 RepID=UPI002F401C1E